MEISPNICSEKIMTNAYRNCCNFKRMKRIHEKNRNRCMILKRSNSEKLRVIFTLIFLIGLNHHSLKGQNYIDIVKIKYQYFEKQKFAAEPMNKVGGSFSEASVLVPLLLNDSNYFLTGLTYARTYFEDKTAGMNGNLYSIVMQLGIDYHWKNKKWKTLAVFLPRISSDLQKLNNRNYQLGGVVLLNYRYKSNLSFTLGLYYNREYFGNYFIPIAGLNWEVNKRWNIYGNLPANINAEYSFGKKVLGGFGYQASTRTYRLNNDSMNLYVKEGDNFLSHAQVKLYANFYLTKHLVLITETGRTLNRIFQVYDDSENKILNPGFIYRKAPDGFFVTAGLSLRFGKS